MKKSLFLVSFGVSFLFSQNLLANDEVVVDLSVLGGVSATPSDNVLPATQPHISYNEHPLLIKENSSRVSSVSSILDLPPLEPKFPVVENKPKPVKAKVVPKQKTITPKKVEQKKEVIREVAPMAEVVAVDEYEALLNDSLVESSDYDFSAKDEVESSLEGKTIVYEFDENDDVISSEKSVLADKNIKPDVVEEVRVSSSGESIFDILSDSEEGIVAGVAHDNMQTEARKARELVDNLVVFKEDSSSLTKEDKVKIDKIIKNFEDVAQNKIGITSYKDETGSKFKATRLTLSRATEVRSYLISKGYKSFDMKTVNINESSDKLNAVEVYEVK